VNVTQPTGEKEGRAAKKHHSSNSRAAVDFIESQMAITSEGRKKGKGKGTTEEEGGDSPLNFEKKKGVNGNIIRLCCLPHFLEY